MIGSEFITNQVKPFLLVLFLDGGDFSHNLMTDALIVGTSDTGRYYNVLYKGTFFRIPVENIKFIVDSAWVLQNSKEPVAGWTEYTVNYSTYLQNIV